MAQKTGPDSTVDIKLYQKNIRIYKDILKAGPDKDITIKLAEALRMIKKYKEAELEYQKFIENPGISPIYYKHYSEILCSLGQEEECKRWQARFKEYEKRADKTSNAIIEIDTSDHFFNRAPFNSTETDFGPAYFKNGLLYISSYSSDSKNTVHEGTGESFYKFYYAEKKHNGGFYPPVEIFKSVDATMYEGPVSISSDNSGIMLVRNNLNQLKAKNKTEGLILQLVKGKIVNNEITDIQEFPYNDNVHTFTHPTLSEDGKELYYASNKDSARGSDIFMSRLINGKWTEPESLGDNVNTSEDEAYPYISQDGKLYFSSNGHNSTGGFDIFVSEKSDGLWTKPVNLGHPFNSIFDDFSFISHSENGEGFIASNRASSLGSDDIFIFNTVFRNKKEERIFSPRLLSLVNKDNFVYQKGNKIKGKLTGPDPSVFAGRVMQLLNVNKQIIKRCYITSDGYFSFSNLKPDNYLILFEGDKIEAKAELIMINRKPGYIDLEDLNKFKIGNISKDSLITQKNNLVIGRLVSLSKNSSKGEIVSLLVADTTGKIVKRIEVAKNNYFIFRNLPADNYFILTEDNNPNFSSDLIYHNPEQLKSISRTTLLDYHYKHITADSLRENNIILHGKVKSNDPENSIVLLLDDDDNVLSKTVPNSDGLFVFRDLDGENMHVMVLNDSSIPDFEHNTVYQKEDSVYHISKNHILEKISLNEEALVKKVIVNGRLTSGNKALDKRLILLIDKNNIVVSHSQTNQDGFFAFQHLNPDDYYIVVNEQEPDYVLETNINYEDNEMQVSKSAFEAFSHKKQHSVKSASINGNAYTNPDKKSLEDKLVLLLNETGNVVGEAVSGKTGKFAFVNLKPEHYLVLFNTFDPSHRVSLKVVEDKASVLNHSENDEESITSLPVAVDKNKVIILFDYNSDRISNLYKKEIEQFVRLIERSDMLNIEITGYADTTGSENFNIKLSEKRIKKSIAVLSGFAGNDKILFNQRPEGKTSKFRSDEGFYIPALNRRVELNIKD